MEKLSKEEKKALKRQYVEDYRKAHPPTSNSCAGIRSGYMQKMIMEALGENPWDTEKKKGRSFMDRLE